MISSDKKILREYIKKILLKEDDGGLGFDNTAPWGRDFTNGDLSKLKKIFITPFTDVIDTAAGQGKELSVKAQTLVATIFKTFASTFVPFLDENYDELFKKNDEQLEKIRAEYKNVLDRTYTSFFDNDVITCAFMIDPAKLLTLAFARKAPIPILNTLSVLTGGKVDNWISKMKKKLKGRDELKPMGPGSDSGPGMAESLIRENNDIASLILQPKVLQLIEKNPEVQNMKKAAQASTREMLNSIYTQAKKINDATSLEQLGMKNNVAQDLKKLPADQQKEISQQMLQSAKEGSKKFYVAKIAEMIAKAKKSGIPNNHPLLADYQKTAQQINSL